MILKWVLRKSEEVVSIDVAQDRDRWALVKVVIKVQFLENA